jgi:hypothetical protein
MALLPVDGSPSDSGLLVRAPGNAFENVSAPSGVLTGPVARQGEQHHDAEADRRQEANVTASDPLALPMKQRSSVGRPRYSTTARIGIQRLRVLAGDQQEEQCEKQKDESAEERHTSLRGRSVPVACPDGRCSHLGDLRHINVAHIE